MLLYYYAYDIYKGYKLQQLNCLKKKSHKVGQNMPNHFSNAHPKASRDMGHHIAK